MLIGRGVDQLEQRITNALCSGNLHLKESGFLQNISRRIGLYRERAFLTDSQASWLYTILTNFEQATKARPSKRKTHAGTTGNAFSHSSPENASESPELMRAPAGLDGYPLTEEAPPKGFDISEALEPSGWT